jgi:hypothetical protein
MDTHGPGSTASAGLVEARHFLREQQRAAARRVGMPAHPAGEGVRAAAIVALRTMFGFEAGPHPTTVHRGSFRYDRATEERRLGIAQDIIERADPGPYEDPTYLALLAYQAASVLIVLSPPAETPTVADHWSRFLLGSIPSTDVNAFATVQAQSGYTVVEVNAALVDFVYQSAKAVVAAQRPTRVAEGRARIVVEGDPEKTRVALERDDAPARHLYGTLEAYLFHGRTRAQRREDVPAEHAVPLSPLIGHAERFVIAHEYGHGTMDARHSGGSPDSPAWTAEFQADNFAMFANVLSVHTLDHMPPEFGLAAAVFALACLDVLRRALAAARDGEVPDDAGSATHPPFALRAERLITGFHEIFRLEYDDDPMKPPRLRTVDPRAQHAPPDEEARHTTRQRATSHADVLHALWERVLPLLQRDHAAGRRLHRMWYGA